MRLLRRFATTIRQRSAPSNVENMKVTKLEHATLLVDKADKRLIIDPGVFMAGLPDSSDVVAIVITHEHGDHWTAERLTRSWARTRRADLRAGGGRGRGIRLRDRDRARRRHHRGRAFTLTFFGEKHAQIHASIPLVDNVGVLVDDALYYPGDSFTLPGVPVDTLAVPIGAPWLKVGDAIDFAVAVAPKRAFPVHDMTLSVAGKDMAGNHVKRLLEQGGGEFVVLQPGESIDL